MNAPLLAPTSPHPVRFTVDEFLRLQDTGVFDRYAKTELIDGEIVGMNAQYSRHARAKTELAVSLTLKLRELNSPLKVLVEVAVQVSDDQLLEPDIVLTDYRGDGIVPVESVGLLVEVSDTTLETDLGRKEELYAAAGVPEYWVIDLTDRPAPLHENPEPDGYNGQLDIELGEVLHSSSIEGLSVDTGELL